MRDGESTGRSSGFDWAVWKKLGPFLRPYRGKLLTVILLMILTSLCDLANPLLLRRAIDRFIVPGQLDGLWGYALAYLGVITFSMLCVVVFCMAAISVEMYVGRDLKRALFKHLQTLSLITTTRRPWAASSPA
jgi:ATP-binding cassette subfamily B protein